MDGCILKSSGIQVCLLLFFKPSEMRFPHFFFTILIPIIFSSVYPKYLLLKVKPSFFGEQLSASSSNIVSDWKEFLSLSFPSPNSHSIPNSTILSTSGHEFYLPVLPF